jgi:hypothetical protein
MKQDQLRMVDRNAPQSMGKRKFFLATSRGAVVVALLSTRAFSACTPALQTSTTLRTSTTLFACG